MSSNYPSVPEGPASRQDNPQETGPSATSTSSSPVPSVVGSSSQRLNAVDALRALALLGILSINVWFFAHPERFESGADDTSAYTAGDQLVRFAFTLLFEGKSYMVFSFLFGLSFVLAWASAARAGLSEVQRSTRRFVALLILGVLHGMFLFAGDILLAYALLGFALLGMRRIRTGWALSIAALVFVLWAGMALLFGLIFSAFADTEVAQEAMQFVEDPEQTRAAYTGGVVSYLGFQLSTYPVTVMGVLFGQGPMAFSAFLVGLVVGRSQLLERIVRKDISTAKLLAWMLPTLIIGVTLSVMAAVIWWGAPGSTEALSSSTKPMLDGDVMVSGALLLLAGPIQATGYVILALLIFRSPAAAWLVKALAPAGRMSLTNYLSQSLVLAIIFSGLGFGLADQLSPVEVAGIVLLLWLCQLGFSAWWFTRFPRGPLEAPVRVWSYRKKNPSQG